MVLRFQARGRLEYSPDVSRICVLCYRSGMASKYLLLKVLLTPVHGLLALSHRAAFSDPDVETASCRVYDESILSQLSVLSMHHRVLHALVSRSLMSRPPWLTFVTFSVPLESDTLEWLSLGDCGLSGLLLYTLRLLPQRDLLAVVAPVVLIRATSSGRFDH